MDSDLEKKCCFGQVRTTYSVFGDPDSKRPLLLIGGLGRLVFRSLVSELDGRYKIIVMDLPGLGEGLRLEPGSYPQMSDLAGLSLAAMDMENMGCAGVMGWALGAQAAVEMARLEPERITCLVAVCGVAGKPFQVDSDDDLPLSLAAVRRSMPAAMDWLSRWLEAVERLRGFLARAPNPSRFAKRLGIIDPLTDEEIFDEVIRGFLSLDMDTHNRYFHAMAEHDATDLLDTLPFPVLAVAGERDLFIDPRNVRRMCERIPRCEYFEVKGATHYLPIEYGALLALKIDDFYKRSRLG